MKNREKIQNVVNKYFQEGQKATTNQIIDAVVEEYPGTKRDSVIPSDYCDNHKNKDPGSGVFKIFHKEKEMGPGWYSILPQTNHNLRWLFSEILKNYKEATKQPFTGHPLASLVRRKSVDIIKPLLEDDTLFVKGSVGQGNWVKVPWIAIINRNETDGAQEGIYIVFLFSEDMRRMYLTLNQGVNRPRQRLGRRQALRQFKATAIDIQTNFPLPEFRSDADVDLASIGLGANYEKAVIYHKEYSARNLPDDNVLVNDLKKLIKFYNNYLLERNALTGDVDFTSFSGGVEEGKRVYKRHCVLERNPKIVKEVKQIALQKTGELRCEVCNFCFSEHYKKRGENFIEAHHNKAVSEMKSGDKTSLENITLVCSNCHRMIHRKMPWLSIKKLKAIYSG